MSKAMITLILSIIGGGSLWGAIFGTVQTIEDEWQHVLYAGPCFGLALWCLVTAIQIVKG